MSKYKAELWVSENAVDNWQYQYGLDAFLAGYKEAETRMLKDMESMAKALEEIEIRLSHCAMTSFPINVRELDGSISQHRPKSNEGHAYDKAREALKNYRDKYGG